MVKLIQKKIALLFVSLSFASSLFAQFQISELQCEYRTNPLGIDELSPRLSWRLSSEKSQTQTAYRILISSSKKTLLEGKGDLWDSGITKSPLTNNIIYRGKPLAAFQTAYWKVMTWNENNTPSDWSEIALFTMGPLKHSDWPADWIGPPKSADKSNFPIYSKLFDLKQIPLDAYMYVNAMGYFELYVNGKKVSDDILSPSVSDFSKHTLYITYDIAPLLKEGKNAISIWMGHGWNRLLDSPRNYYGVVEGVPLVRAFARISNPNKSIEVIRTDRSWKFEPSNRHYVGSWQWGDFGGERLDLSRELNVQNDNFAALERVDNYILHNIPAISQRNNPTQIIDSIAPVEIQEMGNDEYLIDFGKHLTGWIRLEFNGIRSDSILIEYIDKILNKDSISDGIERRFSLDLTDEQDNTGYISYNQHDIIIPAKADVEVFQNKFNYHAYRWIKVSGINRKDIKQLTALQISENNKQIATFECSNPLLNKIWEAVVNTYRCINYSGYVVDCPHRERGGYGGDSHASLETGMSIFDSAPLCNKWTLDWNTAQYPTGLWPHTVPEFRSHKNKFSPGWGGFGMFLPWEFYNYSGDTANLAKAYPYIKKWMKFLESNTVNGILQRDSLEDPNSFGAFHGDWVAPYYGMSKQTRVDEHSNNFFNNCFYLYELDMAKRIATILGKAEDAKHFANLHEMSKPIIHQKFYDPKNSWYVNGEQPYQAFPLLIDLVPDSLRHEIEQLLEYLIVEKNNGHLNTGMLGTYFMLEYLIKANRQDLIYMMVNQKTFPGWGYMIENGATTIWEQWNGDNSQIHNCYLAIGKWFVQGLGGIRIQMDNPGEPTFIINPGYIGDLTFANVSYDTRFGKFSSNWENTKDEIIHRLDIPVNVKTSYRIPDMENINISLDGVNIDTNGNDAIDLGPGSHEIRIAR